VICRLCPASSAFFFVVIDRSTINALIDLRHRKGYSLTDMYHSDRRLMLQSTGMVGGDGAGSRFKVQGRINR